MFDNVTKTIEAWKCDRRSASIAADVAKTQAANLRLQVVDDDSDALTVEVAEGTVDVRDGLLYLQDRGVFIVAATLRRQSVGGARVYLRLRTNRGPAKTAA